MVTGGGASEGCGAVGPLVPKELEGCEKKPVGPGGTMGWIGTGSVGGGLVKGTVGTGSACCSKRELTVGVWERALLVSAGNGGTD